MKSKITILFALTAVLLLGMVSLTHAAVDISFTPKQVPKGAYVNGPVAPSDNYFIQQVTIAFTGADIPLNTNTIEITLPADMEIADTDGSDPDDLIDEVTVSYATAGGTYGLTSATPTLITVTVTADVTNPSTVHVAFPIITSVSPATNIVGYDIAFTGGSIENDDYTGTEDITYFAPDSLSIVEFLDVLTAVEDDPPDTTNRQGDCYPDVGVPPVPIPTVSALPDLIEDEAANTGSSNVVILDNDDAGDVTYTFWISADSTLSHVYEGTGGVIHVLNHAFPGTPLTQVEGEAAAGGYDVYGLVEGRYWVYVTSSLTGDYPLGKSGSLVVRHWPAVTFIGWDVDHNEVLQFGVPGINDENNMTLDSGDYLNYAGDPSGDPDRYQEGDIYVAVDDFDDNAIVYLYYSTEDDLDSTDLVLLSEDPDVVDTLTGAYLIADSLWENSEDDMGYKKVYWDIYTSDTDYVVAGDYYIYAVANDGKNQHVYMGVGEDIPSLERIMVRHSPNMTLDALNEYDADADPLNGIQFETGTYRNLTISWGKAGPGGDMDVDDDAEISLYIDEDDLGDGKPDYGAEEAGQIITDATDGNPYDGNAVLITNGIYENPDARGDNWYSWDLWSYTTFNPDPLEDYHIYAIIDEDKGLGSTQRVVAVGGDDFLQTTDDLPVFEFVHNPTASILTPSPGGDVMNARDLYRFVFKAFDMDQNADMLLILTDTDYGVTNELGIAGVGDGTILGDNNLAGADNEWVLNSVKGEITTPADLEPLKEDDDTAYDFRAKKIGLSGTYLTQDIDNSTAVDLIDGTYYVYLVLGDEGDDFTDGTEPAWRAPGTLRIIGIDDDPPVEYLYLSPGVFNVSRGETIEIDVWANDNDNDVDAVDIFVSVDTTYFYPVDADDPFTDDPVGSGVMADNEALYDEIDGKWILHCFLFEGGSAMDFDPVTGEKICSFTLQCKGVSDAISVTSNVNFVNTEDYPTAFYNDGDEVTMTTRLVAGSAKVLNCAILEGVAELQGRDKVGLNAKISLREVGSYDDIDDSYFNEANDVDEVTDGVQVTLNDLGKFVLYEVPAGTWRLVIHYDRYLDVGRTITTPAGLDTFVVDFGEMPGGDAGGYDDATYGDLPDNQIELFDLTKIYDALGAKADWPEWDDGDKNWKYADIDESGKVKTKDLVMATGHFDGSLPENGEPPVFKPGPGPDDNSGAILELAGLPDKLVEGMTYSVDIVARNVGDLKGYHVQFDHDASAVTVDKVLPGDVYGYSFFSPTNVDGKLGLINAMYGRGHGFAGEGVLATIEFTALKSGAFDESVIGLANGELVTSTLAETDALIHELAVNDMVPTSFELSQNYPNPFNPSTTIRFAVPERSYVSIRIYNILGQEIRTLANGEFDAGRFTVRWDGRNEMDQLVADGVYFYRVVAGSHAAVKKMLLLK